MVRTFVDENIPTVHPRSRDNASSCCCCCGTVFSFSSSGSQSRELISPEGLRLDGRRPGELRKISCEIGLFSRVDGSASIQQGNTKVVVTVVGPKEVCSDCNLHASSHFIPSSTSMCFVLPSSLPRVFPRVFHSFSYLSPNRRPNMQPCSVPSEARHNTIKRS